MAAAGPPDRLAHVLWLGGAPCAGKSTLARLLAERHGLAVYDTDENAESHRGRPAGTVAGWDALSMDERWLLPTPSALATRDLANWTARFPLIVEDLLRMPESSGIVVEGKVFPWSVAPVLSSPRQAVFLLPTPEWRDRVLGDRRRREGPRFEDRTSDPERARANVRARELLMHERIATSCAELGLRCVRVDGSLDPGGSLALLEEHFRPHLPANDP